MQGGTIDFGRGWGVKSALRVKKVAEGGVIAFRKERLKGAGGNRWSVIALQ
ncbi:MAG: hypothetical protein V1932_03350 [Chloroflexota bacterium]